MNHTKRFPVSPHERRCSSCGARWSEGVWTVGCDECDGGAMERPCLVCNGACGARWQRSVDDSHDSQVGHWYGVCLAKKTKS